MGATYAQIVTKLVAAIAVEKHLLDAVNGLSGNSSNFLALANTANSTALADPVQNAEYTAAQEEARAKLEAVLASEAARLEPFIEDLGLAIGSQASTTQARITDLIAYMNGNGDRVKKRTFSNGAFAGGSPYVGTGSVLQVRTDANGFPLEARTPEVIAAVVIADASGGTQNKKANFAGQEIWQLAAEPHGGYVERGLSGRGSGWTGTFTGANGDDSLLDNPSFSEISGTDSAPTDVTGWDVLPAVVGDGTDLVVDRTYYYQEFKGQNGSPGALQLKVQKTLTQPFSGSSDNVNAFNPDNKAPFHSSLRFLPKVPTKTGAAGVLYAGPGSKKQAVVVQGMALAAADSGSAGNVNGTVDYVVLFRYTVDGGSVQKSMYGAAKAITVSNKQVSLSSIPLGPAGTYDGKVYATTGREVYRTTDGGTTYKLLTTLADNTTTIYTDNTADGSLGATIATANGDAWQITMLEDAGSEANLWFANWTTAGAGFVVSWNPTAASGPLNIDRGLLCQYDMIPATIPQTTPATVAGTAKASTNPASFILFLSACPGTPAGSGKAWQYGDKGTITNTESNPNGVQDHFERAFQRCLPSAGSAVGNWGDPA